ncbi:MULTISPECIES: NCS2 family permease [unclassified Agarivorans]|uniref:NCS2 family permease n=1 Tax=unclassified Agarivorans TaxID=2636026 RepID=UPI0010E65E22|nr:MULTISPECIES: NCS2 family permease [unclassified Agarivorans]MDO6687651.1 NCS2 family permease [Agarivorans sp. 3_MG-2023]MDO6717205.1 NCS2 family permease [Agarivorans sp. 2_MG-2023]MDO6765805.1 NCS2 family permease [Agarivorans sp. 1_MG-2023]GDY24372.1 adenine permease [Agarivorans sp. Toyoura001]
MLEKLFKLKAHGTDVRTEVIAGLTTFLTMAYIIFVNPSMLAATGMDQGAVFVATCLAAAVGCFIMGLYANYPIAQAPGMGLNAFFTYGVVLGMGHSWQVALGAVFLSGVIFICLSLFKVREWIINSIPQTLRVGIAAGIGLFLGFIALKNAGIVVDNPATLVSLGHENPHQMILAALGFFLIIGLEYRKVKGGVLISILAITVLSIVLGYTQYGGIVSMPPNPAPTFMQLDIMGALDVTMISVIFAFLFVDLFDTAGTLTAVAQRGKLLDENGNLPNLRKALLADSSATIAGSMLGTSSTTSYVESGAGVEVGGRTGLTAVVVGVLFILALLFSPLAGMIPAYATAGALFYVCTLMLSGLINVDWTDLTEAAPAAIVAILMPLSFSIADGIAIGFISYAAIKLLAGRHKEVPLSVWVLAVVFVLKFAFF